MPDSPNSFFWYELITTDLDAAEAFYRAAIGWDMRDAGQGDMRYTVVEADGRGIGGLMALSDIGNDSARPGWGGYIKVADTQAAVERLLAAGGTVRKPTETIPGIGPFAVVADPQGASFLFLAPIGEAQPPVAPNTPGHIGWHELYAGDGTTIFDFYGSQFGWSKDQALDMGEMGTYQLIAMGGEPNGGIMTKPAGFPGPLWLFYIQVAGGADAAAARIVAGGGKLVYGPAEVPGGGWIVQATDPQGLMFAIVAGEK